MSRYAEITRPPRGPNGIASAKRRMKAALRRRIRTGSDLVESLSYRGWGRTCPVCGRASRRFITHGTPPRPEARCVHCGSLERHRFAWAYLQSETDLFDGRDKRVLHFAPEDCFEPRLRSTLGNGYVTADLTRQNVDATVDVTDIPYPDGSFDVILCSHVLEHVPDDRKAMRELARILADDGWALLMVPIEGSETFEDPSIVEPDRRAAAFGQADHVRMYGTDIVGRLEDAGFDVTVAVAGSFIDPDDWERLGLGRARRRLFICDKAVG